MNTVTMSCWVERGMQSEALRTARQIAQNVGGEVHGLSFVHSDEMGNRLYTADVHVGKVGAALFNVAEWAFWDCAVDGVDWDGVLVDAPVFAAG